MFGFVIPLEPLAIGIEELPAVVLALMCMLVVGAGWVIMAVVFEIFGNISVLGAHPFGLAAGLLSGLINKAMNKLGGFLMKYLDPVGNFFYGLAMTLWRPLYVIGATIAGLTTQLLGLSQSTSSGFTDVRGAIVAGDQAVTRAADNEITQNVGTLNNRITAIQNDTNTAISDLGRTVSEDYNGAISHADDLYNRVEGDLTNSVRALQATIASDTNDAINHANDLYNRVEGDLTNSVRSLTQADATNLQTAENFATSLVGGLGLGSLRSTVTALQGQVSKIQTETDECLTPLCDTVTPQAPRLGRLGNLFQELEALGFDALIVAMAAEALHDPAAVVSDVKTVVSDVGSPLMTAFRDLIGA